MNNNNTKAMRDVFIEQLYYRMAKNKKIFFLSADFGSPKLDQLRNKFKDRFINVGIAEQNLINVATGLALEGFIVYAYGLAPFVSMRAYEQIRVNAALHAQLKKININLIGVGAGLSYEVSGPTHHCLEDIAIIRTLPNLILFSPSDWMLSEKFVDFSIKVNKPKYIRFDAKPLPPICSTVSSQEMSRGFRTLRKGKKVCIVSTGYLTHTALKVADLLAEKGVDVELIDAFILKPFNADVFYGMVKKFNYIITMEEGFINKGGLDSLIASILDRNNSSSRLVRMGFDDAYVFSIGNRKYLHQLHNLDEISIARQIKSIIHKQ